MGFHVGSIRSTVLAGLLGLAAAAFPALSPAAELTEEAPAATDTESRASANSTQSPKAADLGQLLEAADKDVGALTKVSVAAPALQSEVSTVARHESTVGRSPAAVYVVTNEMLRRSGVRTIPDALRLVPGVNVERIDANKWAVSIRGFNGRFANKLLVQIDGRSVYDPLFGGVWWDAQDLVLEDVDRIEVIRGPGASVWGANAVNGIINIITKKSSETQGGLIQGGAGSEERGFATARYGGVLSENGHYRAYGKWFDRDAGYSASGNALDGSQQGRGGFRADWTLQKTDTFTLQGDAYSGTSGGYASTPTLNTPNYLWPHSQTDLIDGQNILFRWQRELDVDSDWAIQTYYDHTNRIWTNNGFAQDRSTFDLDFQHRFPLTDRQRLIWGLGYRNTADKIHDSDLRLGAQPIISFPKHERSDNLFSGFVQDEITLREDRWFFIAGSKFERNDYTDFEYQPTGRILWTPNKQCSMWAAVSRAVRTPTRGEVDEYVYLPAWQFLNPSPPPTTLTAFPYMRGNPGLQSEDVMSYEAGIRMQPEERFFWDLAVFFNQYEKLRGSRFESTIVPGYPIVIPGMIVNNVRIQTYGFEIANTYEIREGWRLINAYTFLVMSGSAGSEYADTRNQYSLQSSWDLGNHVQFDLAWRYVDVVAPAGSGRSPWAAIPSYNVMDARLAWTPRRNLELAVIGRNLLNPRHYEAPPDQFLGVANTEVESEVYGMATWRF